MEPIKANYFCKKDIPIKVSWMNDKRINNHMFFSLPATIKNTETWFELNKENKNRVDFSFTSNGEFVAMGGFTTINYKAEHSEFYIMVNPDMHGKGIGSKVSYWMYNYAFLELSLNKIYLYTNNENIAAYKMYENAGFSLEGILRQHKSKNDELLDRRFYGLLREEWKNQSWKLKTIDYVF